MIVWTHRTEQYRFVQLLLSEQVKFVRLFRSEWVVAKTDVPIHSWKKTKNDGNAYLDIAQTIEDHYLLVH